MITRREWGDVDHLAHGNIAGVVVAGSGNRPLRPRVTDLLGQLIAEDRATLVPHPIREAEVVYPNVVEAGAHGCGCAQRRSPAPFAMGDDVIARRSLPASAYFAEPVPDGQRRCPADRYATDAGRSGDADCDYGCGRPLQLTPRGCGCRTHAPRRQADAAVKSSAVRRPIPDAAPVINTRRCCRRPASAIVPLPPVE